MFTFFIYFTTHTHIRDRIRWDHTSIHLVGWFYTVNTLLYFEVFILLGDFTPSTLYHILLWSFQWSDSFFIIIFFFLPPKKNIFRVVSLKFMNTWCIHGLFPKTQTNNINEAANQSFFLFHYFISALEFNVRQNEIIVYMKKFNFKSNNKKKRKEKSLWHDMCCSFVGYPIWFASSDLLYIENVYLFKPWVPVNLVFTTSVWLTRTLFSLL